MYTTFLNIGTSGMAFWAGMLRVHHAALTMTVTLRLAVSPIEERLFEME